MLSLSSPSQRFIRILLLLACCACGPSFLNAQPIPEADLPLPENYLPVLKNALETAVQQSPRMIARNTELVVADANRIISRSSQLPSMGFTGTYYPWTRDKRASGGVETYRNTDRTTYYLTIHQAAYHWGALRNAARIGALRLKIAEGQTAEVYRLLAQEIRSLYLQLILKKASLARSRLAQQQAEEKLSLAKDNLERRLIARASMYGPEMAFEYARLATDRAVDDYETSKASFARLCGRPPLAEDEIPEEIPAFEQPEQSAEPLLTEFSSRDELDTYALANMRKQVEAARLEHRIARVRLRPKLGLTVGVSQDEVSYYAAGLPGSRSGVQSLFTGLTVNWPIFDGFAAKGAKVSALARLRQLERSYADATVETREAVKSKLRQLEFAARALKLAEYSFAVDRGGYEAKKEDVELGLSAPSELLASEIGFRGSRISAYSTRADYLMKVADFLSSVGKDPALANLPAQYR